MRCDRTPDPGRDGTDCHDVPLTPHRHAAQEKGEKRPSRPHRRYVTLSTASRGLGRNGKRVWRKEAYGSQTRCSSSDKFILRALARLYSETPCCLHCAVAPATDGVHRRPPPRPSARTSRICQSKKSSKTKYPLFSLRQHPPEKPRETFQSGNFANWDDSRSRILAFPATAGDLFRGPHPLPSTDASRLPYS